MDNTSGAKRFLGISVVGVRSRPTNRTAPKLSHVFATVERDMDLPWIYRYSLDMDGHGMFMDFLWKVGLRHTDFHRFSMDFLRIVYGFSMQSISQLKLPFDPAVPGTSECRCLHRQGICIPWVVASHGLLLQGWCPIVN